MAGMFDYEDPEYVPGAGQGLSPLSWQAATKYAQDLARFGKGAVTGTVGALGDVESFGRGVRSAVNPQGSTVLNAFLSGMNQPTVLPTSSDVNKAINPYMPSFMAGEATAPQQIGEFVSLGGLLSQAAKRVPSLVRATENAPVGLSIKPVQGAPKSGLGFYSAVEDAALNLQRNSGAGQAFLNDIKKGANVKDEEIKWIGLDEFLAGKKNVTKQEVQDYIANNKVDVQEVALGGKQSFDSNRLDELLFEYSSLKQHPIDDPSFGQEKYDELIRLMNIRDQSTTDTLYQQAEEFERMAQRAQRNGNTLVAEKYFREAELFNTRAEKLDLEGQGMDSPPKFGQYTLPGGENYREILLTMPSKAPKDFPSFDQWLNTRYGGEDVPVSVRRAAEAEYERQAAGLTKYQGDFRSSHWEQPNVLAHIRVNDRVDADGKKMLLIEEVQSDWHQAGRDKGYQQQGRSIKEIRAEISEVNRERYRLLEEADALPDSRMEEFNAMNERYRELGIRARQLNDEFDAAPNPSGVPDAPMKDTWYQLALKRALQYAAENGYDRVGLTTGSRQAERYDLSKQISEVNYSGTNFVAYDKNGDAVIQRTGVSEADLPNLIGKDAARKLLEQPKQGTLRSLSGVDLQVGGEGMKKYYDEVYPKFLQKYGKKWDAKMGNTTIEADGAEPVRYIDVTPKMKQSVTETGQPLFSVAAPIGTGALAYEEINRTGLENPLLKD